MKTKTTAVRLAAGLMAFGLVAAACGGDDDDGGGDASEAANCDVDQTDGDLAIYNWAEYIDQEQLDAFAAEYDVGVTMDTYDSNEAIGSRWWRTTASSDRYAPP